MDIKLSENFMLSEFLCPCGCLAGDDLTIPMEVPFIMKLQKLRTRFQKPIIITSGYRCPSYNKRIGGAPNSKHCLGIAADVSCTNSKDRFTLLNLAFQIGFSGIGVDRTFLHLDIRESEKVCWTY